MSILNAYRHHSETSNQAQFGQVVVGKFFILLSDLTCLEGVAIELSIEAH